MATTDTPAKPKPAAPKPAAPREYIVFASSAADEFTWEEVGRATALTRDDALDKVVDGLPAGEQDGPFVAVAAKFWQPTEPVVRTVTKRSWK